MNERALDVLSPDILTHADDDDVVYHTFDDEVVYEIYDEWDLHCEESTEWTSCASPI